MRHCWKLIISTFTSPAHQFCRWSIPYIACPAVYQSIEVTLSNTKSIQLWDFLDQLQYFEGTSWLVLHCQLFRYGRRKTNNRFTYLFVSFTNQCLWIHGKVPWPKSHAIVHISIFQKEKTLQPENKQKWRQNWGILKLRRLCCQVGVISFIWPQEHVASCCYERSLLEGYIAKRNPFCESNRSRIDALALFCLNVLSIKVGFSYMSHPKGCNFSSIFFRLLLPLPYSINFSQCFDVAGTQHVRWIKFDGWDQTRGISSAFIEPHFCKNFTPKSTLSLTYLPIHCGGWRVPFLQREHWQMDRGYYSSSKSFNSGCNGLAGGGSKNSNAFLHSGKLRLPHSLLRIPRCNVIKKAGMLVF